MPQPPAYNRTKDFTEDFGSETDHSSLNTELDTASNSINDIRTSLAILQADDGKLNPDVVTTDSISADVRNDLSAGILAAVGSSVADAAASAAAAAASETNLATAVTQANASKVAAAASEASALASKNASDLNAASALSSKNTVVAAESNVTTLAATVASNKTATDANAASALANKNASDTNAATATTQAGIATTQAGIATTQAGIASTQSGIATTKASEAAASAAAAATFDPALYLAKAGNETKSGVLTFADSPEVPDLVVGDTSRKAANAKLVADSIAARLQIAVRQSIQYGPTTGTPAVSNLIPQSQLGATLATGVTLKCSTAATLFSVANGFNADGSPNNLNWLASADIAVPNLTASSTNYIWVDTVAQTAGFVTVADTEQKGGTIPVTSGKYTVDTSAWKMYLGNDTTAAQSNRIIVAEVDTDGTVITAIRCRPYLLEYESALYGLALASAYTVNHNMGMVPKTIRTVLVCGTSDGGAALAGEEIEGHATHSSNNSSVGFVPYVSRNSVRVNVGATGLYLLNSSGSAVAITVANYKLRTYAKGR